ncbi:MAG: flagellar filament capping protein FliD [Acutalibacter sp.]|jgi:flagellar hook-associated protein 2|nr:flagellar filament capping protein FliD [Acutalibacter sp.]
MASITSLMNSSSSTSSLYGNRNIISGLASGMDTESMIENSVAGYKSKITSLQQKMTKLQWKQDAYRGLISSMNSILNKYTSFTSSTNLFSASFFSKAVNAVAKGANAAMVAVSGKGTSDVQIDRIKQLAQAASYSVSAKDLAATGAATEAVNWSEKVSTSAVAGSISIKYGGGETGKGSSFTLRFDEGQVFGSAQELADAINKQLEEKNVTSSKGTSKASEYLEASVGADGRVILADKKGNNFKITGTSGGMANFFDKTEEAAGVSITGSNKPFTVDNLVEKKGRNEYLADKSIQISLDGKVKTIKLDFLKDNTDIDSTEKFAEALQEKLDAEFGKDRVAVQASADGKLEFGTKKNGKFETFGDGSVFKVLGSNNTVNNALGLGEGGYSNTVQTSWTLERVLGADKFETRTDEDGNTYQAADLIINGEKIELKSTDTIQNMMDKINSSDAGVNIKYSSLTGQFSMTATETGADSKIEIEGKLGKALFGMDTSKEDDVAAGDYKKGQDAEFTVTVNGKQMELTRSSNNVDLDGYNVTLKGAFGYNADGTVDNSAEPITFETNTDSDKIVDAIKEFVKDYNEMVTALRSAYTTEPLTNTKKEEYQPLTDEDQAKMSESAIKNYEEKAKTGLLYADMDLANLYSKLTSAVQGDGELGATLRSIGLEVKFADGLSTIELDEDALRDALESDPDKVKNAFTQTTANGASTNGLMYNLKSTIEMYASTSIGSPGILVNKAGTTLSSYSLNNNELNDQINNLQEQIEKWQDRMSDRVDFYTNQFTQLELLINKMNSQSSMLAGLSGGM